MSSKIIHLISGPRNLSTALMYSFAQRTDTKVIDEPYYGAYLTMFDVDHPGRVEVLQQMEHDFDKVTASILNWDTSSVYFVKNMAHHLIDRPVDFLKDVTNVFLIRNPYQLIASFTQVIPNPTMQDIGIKHECELFNEMKADGTTPIVLDSAELLENPEEVLFRLCEKLEIPFKENMLHWKAGGIPEDGCWAKYWYKNVHNSTGFAKQETSKRTLPEHCQQLYDEAQPYYEELNKHSIKI